MTLTCGELVDLICDFLGEELDAGQKAAFEEHVCGCPDCVVQVELYRVTVVLTRALPRCEAVLPPGCEERLRAALAAAPQE